MRNPTGWVWPDSGDLTSRTSGTENSGRNSVKFGRICTSTMGLENLIRRVSPGSRLKVLAGTILALVLLGGAVGVTLMVDSSGRSSQVVQGSTSAQGSSSTSSSLPPLQLLPGSTPSTAISKTATSQRGGRQSVGPGGSVTSFSASAKGPSGTTAVTSATTSTTTTTAPQSDWQKLSPPTSPPATVGASMAYDSATKQVVLFGGSTNESNPMSSQTWLWNGTTWNDAGSAGAPSGRDDAVMAFDPATNQIVLFGGMRATQLGDTWVWNGSAWRNVEPAVSPPARANSSLAYDSGSRQLVLYGGNGPTGSPNGLLGDTWTWNGTTWTQQHPSTNPGPLSEAVMATDPTTGHPLLFGGADSSGYRNQTWTWVENNWRNISVPGSPSPRHRFGMVADTTHDQIVLFGGETPDNTYLAETWIWNGRSWSQDRPTVSPGPTFFPGMSDDPASGDVVEFGGNSGNQINGNTWAWKATT
jgi:hypothetical protein